MARDTPRRTAALSALSRTRAQLDRSGAAGSDSDSGSEDGSDCDSAGEKRPSEDEEEDEGGEDTGAESSANEPLSVSTEPPETLSEDAVRRGRVRARGRGRGRGRGLLRGAHSTRTRREYRTGKAAQYAPVSPRCHDLAAWMDAAASAAPLKRRLRGKKDASELDAKFVVPPVDLLDVRLPAIDEFDPVDLAVSASLPKLSDSVDLCVSAKEIAYTSHKLPSVQTLTVRGGGDATTADDLLCVLNCGAGGVTAMDWSAATSPSSALEESAQLLAISCAASYGDATKLVPDPNAAAAAFGSKVSIWRVTLAESRPFVRGRVVAVFEASFGAVKQLAWCPHRTAHGPVLLVLFATGRAHLFRIDPEAGGTFSARAGLAIGDGETAATVAAWCPCRSDADLVAVGTSDGRVLLWRVSGAAPEMVGGIRPSRRPITSLAFHHQDPQLLAVGLHDSPAVLVDWRDALLPITLQSTLSYVPVVRWSQIHGAWILADSEQYCRAMPAAALPHRHSFPVGTLCSPALDVAVSRWHNILALAAADGAVHLSWPDTQRETLAVEKAVFAIEATGPHSVAIASHMRMPKASRTVGLYPAQNSIAAVVWSASPASPGLLAFASGAVGVVFLATADRLALISPET